MASPKLSQDNSRSKNSHHSVSISPNCASIQSGRGIQSVRDQIEKAFASLRTIERRRYTKPGELNPAFVGRRKEDPPRPQLAQLAQPILRQIQTTGCAAQHRKNGIECWDLGDEPVVENVPKLFDAALMALGYQPEKPMDELSPKANISAAPEESSIWKRGLFKKVAR